MTHDVYMAFRERAKRLGRPGMAALLGLEYHFGLRAKEALCARIDTLQRWLDEISDYGKITVLAGTKGGRRRQVHVADVALARQIAQTAIKIAVAQGGFLAATSSRSKSNVKSLAQAVNLYRSYCHRAGVQAHCARYAFARRQYEYYRSRGYSHREALIAVSQDLGHGDGRGRWVKSVYLR